MKHFFNYLLVRILTFPFSLLSFKIIHAFGKVFGNLAYFVMPESRKRVFSHISLSGIATTEKQMRQIAKEAFQNVMIVCLEYAKFGRKQQIADVLICQNPEEAEAILSQGKGIIFFCGHQANWEVLFLEGTSRMKGVAIGRPIKNRFIYNWILKMREKFGGKIFPPKNGIKEGLRALKKGYFLGIVGDQGMPDSGFSSPFFGKKAWTSPIPAILAYKTGAPLVVATTVRKKGRYVIHYSSPIWPIFSEPMENEIERMMHLSLKLLEDSIREHPGQWLWQHNRWKQQTPEKVKKRFRHESICVLFPQNEKKFEEILLYFRELRSIYPREFLTVLIPHKLKERFIINDDLEIISYHKEEELLLHDYRFKLVFNFTDYIPAKKHYLALSAFEVLTLSDLKKLAEDAQSPYEILTKALCHAR